MNGIDHLCACGCVPHLCSRHAGGAAQVGRGLVISVILQPLWSSFFSALHARADLARALKARALATLPLCTTHVCPCGH
jgi:hypothetical protein